MQSKVGLYAILEFRGKVNSRTQCVYICPLPPLPPRPSSSGHTTDTGCTHACHLAQDGGGGKVLMACIQNGLALATARYCPPRRPPRRRSSGNKRRRKRAFVPINQGVVYTLLWRGLPSLFSRLSPPPSPPSPFPWCLSLAGGGGVLTHLSMAAWLLRGRMEDNRIGNATRASSFPPASVSIYLPGAARIRVYAVGFVYIWTGSERFHEPAAAGWGS